MSIGHESIRIKNTVLAFAAQDLAPFLPKIRKMDDDYRLIAVTICWFAEPTTTRCLENKYVTRLHVGFIVPT